MQHAKRNTVVVLVLAAYLLVGAIGFWDALGHAFLFGTHPWVITKGKSGLPPPTKVVWTQQKHYPSSSHDTVPLAAVIATATDRHSNESFCVSLIEPPARNTFDRSEERSPRAPPLS